MLPLHLLLLLLLLALLLILAASPSTPLIALSTDAALADLVAEKTVELAKVKKTHRKRGSNKPAKGLSAASVENMTAEAEDPVELAEVKKNQKRSQKIM